jgi:4-hydroxy-tetrahydrodipicolinate reductase
MKVCICGICGRMGTMVLIKLIDRGHTLGAAFDSESANYFGDDACRIIHSPLMNVRVGKINPEDLRNVDGVIDFSSPGATLKLLDHSVEMGKPVVIGTTGFSDDEKKKIKKASEKIPLLLSPNMSVGVNLLFKLTELASRALGNNFDIEVFEAHHRFKKDAPSGTAKKLVEIIKSSVPELVGCREISGREGITGERTDREIGVLAMRGGDIVGEHTVFYAGMGERIELTHRASSRDTFASGAVTALEYIAGKEAGLYSMFDVLGL